MKEQKAVKCAALNGIWKISVKFSSQYMLLLSSEAPWFLECSALVYTSMSEFPINSTQQTRIFFCPFAAYDLIISQHFFSSCFNIWKSGVFQLFFQVKDISTKQCFFSFKISRCSSMRNGNNVGGGCIFFAESLWLTLYN